MTTPTNLPGTELPAAVARYVEAERTYNLTLLPDCFAPAATVYDEAREYHGLEAIITWKTEAAAKYHSTFELLDAVVGLPNVNLKAKLVGNFPGSPVELDYAFTLTNDKISTLTIS